MDPHAHHVGLLAGFKRGEQLEALRVEEQGVAFEALKRRESDQLSTMESCEIKPQMKHMRHLDLNT